MMLNKRLQSWASYVLFFFQIVFLVNYNITFLRYFVTITVLMFAKPFLLHSKAWYDIIYCATMESFGYTHWLLPPTNFGRRFMQNQSRLLWVNLNVCCPLNSAYRLSPPVIFLRVFSSSTARKLISEKLARRVPYMSTVPNRASISFKSMPMKLPFLSIRSTRLLSWDLLVSPLPTRNSDFFWLQLFIWKYRHP